MSPSPEEQSARAKLINRVREDLVHQACYLTPYTIQRVLDIYDERRARAGEIRTDALPEGVRQAK